MCFFTICRRPKFKILSPSIFDAESPLRSCVLSPYHLGHTAHRRRSRTESRTWSRSRCRIWSRTSPPAAWCTAPPAQSRKSPSTCLRKPAQEDVRNHWTIPWRPGELYLIAFLLGYCGALSVLKRMYKWLFTALATCTATWWELWRCEYLDISTDGVILGLALGLNTLQSSAIEPQPCYLQLSSPRIWSRTCPRSGPRTSRPARSCTGCRTRCCRPAHTPSHGAPG